jgi:MFS family permease
MKPLRDYLALEGNIRVLALQILFSQMGFGMIYVIWQPYILSKGLDVTALGLVQSMINLSTGGGLIAWGYLSDRFGRKRVLVMADACRLLSVGILMISGSLPLLLVFAFFAGFSAFWMVGNPARSAIIAESVPEGRMGAAYSTLMAVSQITSTVVASAGGYIAVTIGYDPIFYVTLLGTLTGLILNAVLLEETKSPSMGGDPGIPLKEQLLKALIPERYILNLYLILFINGFGYSTAYSILYGTLVESFGFTSLQLGLLSTSFNLGWGLLSIPLGNVTDRIGRRNSLLASWWMALLTVTLFLLSRGLTGFIIAQVISALDVAFWMPAWNSIIAEKVPSGERSTAFGKIGAYSKIAAIPAPWLAGILYENYGYHAPLLVQVFCLFSSFLLIYWIKE